MAEQGLVIHSEISPDVFREFSYFDIFSRQKRWRGPLLFAVILTFASAIVFSRADSTRGAGLLGVVLLAVGLGLPLVYFGTFFLSVRKQSRVYTGNVRAYTVELTGEGARVTKDKQEAFYPWDRMAGAYRLGGSVALYVDPAHAFLLTGDLDRVWNAVTAHLPAERCKINRT